MKLFVQTTKFLERQIQKQVKNFSIMFIFVHVNYVKA